MQFALLSTVFAALASATLTNCPGASVAFTASSVSLNPEQILVGSSVSVKAVGALTQDILEGATYKTQLKLGSLTVFTETHPLCAFSACPIVASPNAQITVTQPVPAKAPAGKFNLQVTVSDKDGKQVACLAGPVELVKTAAAAAPVIKELL